ncbi:MAG: hypothetical protein ACRC10_06300 [Thermoguttaceae bacterium]
MKILQTVLKAAIPGIPVIVVLFPFFALLNEEHRFVTFQQMISLLLGNWFLWCIIVVEAFVIWHMKTIVDLNIVSSNKEIKRLESEIRSLKRELKATRQKGEGE